MGFGVYYVYFKGVKWRKSRFYVNQNQEEKMGKNEVVKKDKNAYKAIWHEALPGLLEKNISLQAKALAVIEEKIDQVSAAQAATIYGILHDKCQMIMGASGDQNNTVNMYFGGNIPSDDDVGALMERVVARMQKKDDAEFEVVEEKEAEKI